MFFGIYGFKFDVPIQCVNYKLKPLPVKKPKSAVDRDNFYLTGYLEIDTDYAHNTEKDIFIISSILTFIQQQHVIITFDRSETIAFPEKLGILVRRTKGGELVINDSSKELLLNLLIKKLDDANFLRKTNFETTLFRNIEIWRLNSHFVEITYYFCFSGIEALARCSLNDDVSSAAQVISPFLRNLGFKINQDEIQDYTHVRNALFHSGCHVKTINKNGTNTELKLIDFEDKIMRLFPDVLLKVIGFDDNHINWNRWKDLMAFR